ncbi:MAG: four helix bundle protein [Kosmotogaceae bacterium]
MSYKELKVWQTSIDLVTDIYKITEDFPQNKLYGLTSQMCRAAVSVPSNIAEGNGRAHEKEYLHFLHLAKGSLLELMTQLEIANRLNFLEHNRKVVVNQHCELTLKMLHRLIAAIKKHSASKQ